MTCRIALLGLSGVGKTTMLNALSRQIDFRHLEASRLIKAEQERRSMASQSSEDLRMGPVLDNQTLLISGFKHEVAESDLPIVFDGHSVIDGRDGLIEIPIEIFAALELNAICFLKADPSEIFARRQADAGRLRPRRTESALAEHKVQAIEATQAIAEFLRCPLVLINNKNHLVIAKIILDLNRSSSVELDKRYCKHFLNDE